MTATLQDQLIAAIRTIPDYPHEGIMFRDITTLIANAAAFDAAINALIEPYKDKGITQVAGIEARGFIFGGAMAQKLGAGFTCIRKKGKLPFDTISQEYELEYGTDKIEMHTDALASSDKVLVVDDLIATGGTAEAGIKLIRQFESEIVAACFVIDLPDLGGRKKIEELGVQVTALIEFEGL